MGVNKWALGCYKQTRTHTHTHTHTHIVALWCKLEDGSVTETVQGPRIMFDLKHAAYSSSCDR